jgi:hypothetical protein
MTRSSHRSLLALLAAALTLAGCDTLDRTKNWFSSSDYDPEIEAIEREVPPPEEPLDPAAALGPAGTEASAAGYLRTAGEGHVVTSPPRGMTVRLGSSVIASTTVARPQAAVSSAETDLVAASSETGLTRPADPPPLGYSRVRHGTHGTALAPFRQSPFRSLR